MFTHHGNGNTRWRFVGISYRGQNSYAQEVSEPSTSNAPPSCDASCGTNNGSSSLDNAASSQADAGLPDNSNGQPTDDISPLSSQQDNRPPPGCNPDTQIESTALFK